MHGHQNHHSDPQQMAQSLIGAPCCHDGVDAGRVALMTSLQTRRMNLGPEENTYECCSYFSIETKAALSG